MGIFRRFRAVFALAALVSLAACVTWEPYALTPGQNDLPAAVRVTLDTGEQTEIYEPEFQGDTLLVGHGNSADARWETRAVYLTRIRGIERKATSWSVAWAVVGVGLVAMLVYGASQCSGESSYIC